MSSKTIRLHAPLTGLHTPDSVEEMARKRELRKREEAAYQRGYEEASRFLQQQLLEQRQSLMHLQGELFEKLAQQGEELTHQVFQAIPDLVLEGVRRVLADIELDAGKIRKLVEQVLDDLYPEREGLRVTLAPQDLKTIRSIMDEFEQRFPGISFEEDPSLRSGDCMVRSRFGITDARMETKMRSLEAHLK